MGTDHDTAAFAVSTIWSWWNTTGTAIRASADVSVTVRMDPAVKAAITLIPQDAWTRIEYPDAIFDEPTGRWTSRAEVAEIPFTAFRSKKKTERVTGRLVLRRIADLNLKHVDSGLPEQRPPSRIATARQAPAHRWIVA